MGLSNELSCEAGSFSHHLQPPQVFSVRGFEALFYHTGTLGCMVYLAPHLLLPVYLHTNVGPPRSSNHCLHPFPPGCPSLPLLPVWMNVSSLTPWLSDFHTIQFSLSFGVFLFLSLLFFCLCEEAQCIYLCLHLGQKSIFILLTT